MKVRAGKYESNKNRYSFCDIKINNKDMMKNLIELMMIKTAFHNPCSLQIFICGNFEDDTQYIRVITTNKNIKKVTIKNEILSYFN